MIYEHYTWTVCPTATTTPITTSLLSSHLPSCPFTTDMNGDLEATFRCHPLYSPSESGWDGGRSEEEEESFGWRHY